MKIEIGESLIYSWLRHIKQCQIVQNNWKVSPRWEATSSYDENSIVNLIKGCNEDFNKFFENEFNKKNCYILKKSKYDQFIKQAEADPILVKTDSIYDRQRYYSADVKVGRKTFKLTNYWFEKHKDKLLKWITKHESK